MSLVEEEEDKSVLKHQGSTIESKMCLIYFSDALLLAVKELGAREHRLRSVPLQASNAKQVAARISRLRGGKPSATPKDVQPKVGLYIHAGRGTN